MPTHRSNLRITWDPYGAALVLLDFGDLLGEFLSPGMEQGISIFAAIGAGGADAYGAGGTRQAFTWSRRREHADEVAALSLCWTHPHTMPWGQEKPMLVEILNGPDFELGNGVIHSAVTVPHFPMNRDTITHYQASAKSLTPISNFPLVPGLPWSWILTAWEDIDVAWQDL